MTGSRSTSASIIWNDRLPAPTTIDALNSMTGTPLARRTDRFRPDSGDGWKRTRLIGQAAQIDDAADAGTSGRAAEVCCRVSIHLREIRTDRHGVHQVVSRIHASESDVQRLLIEAIPLDDLRR